MAKPKPEIKPRLKAEPDPHKEDMDQLKQALNGDQEAFRKMVLRYEGQIYSTVLGMLGNEDDAKDITQQVFIRFYKSMGNFKGDSSLPTYLTRIGINQSLNELKRRKRKFLWMRPIRKEDQITSIEDENANPEREDTRNMVQKAIQILEPEFRSVVVLRMIEGYSTQETADILELPIGTVGSRLNRARKQLKEILSGWLDRNI